MRLLHQIVYYLTASAIVSAAPLSKVEQDPKYSRRDIKFSDEGVMPATAAVGGAFALALAAFGGSYYLKGVAMSKALNQEVITRADTLKSVMDFQSMFATALKQQDEGATATAVGNIYDLMHQTFTRERAIAQRRLGITGEYALTDIEKQAVKLYKEQHAEALKALEEKGRSMTLDDLQDFVAEKEVVALASMDIPTSKGTLKGPIAKALNQWYGEQTNAMRLGAQAQWDEVSTELEPAIDKMLSDNAKLSAQGLEQSYSATLRALRARKFLNSVEQARIYQGTSRLSTQEQAAFKRFSNDINHLYSSLTSNPASVERLTSALGSISKNTKAMMTAVDPALGKEWTSVFDRAYDQLHAAQRGTDLEREATEQDADDVAEQTRKLSEESQGSSIVSEAEQTLEEESSQTLSFDSIKLEETINSKIQSMIDQGISQEELLSSLQSMTPEDLQSMLQEVGDVPLEAVTDAWRKISGKLLQKARL